MAQHKFNRLKNKRYNYINNEEINMAAFFRPAPQPKATVLELSAEVCFSNGTADPEYRGLDKVFDDQVDKVAKIRDQIAKMPKGKNGGDHDLGIELEKSEPAILCVKSTIRMADAKDSTHNFYITQNEDNAALLKAANLEDSTVLYFETLPNSIPTFLKNLCTRHVELMMRPEVEASHEDSVVSAPQSPRSVSAPKNSASADPVSQSGSASAEPVSASQAPSAASQTGGVPAPRMGGSRSGSAS